MTCSIIERGGWRLKVADEEVIEAAPRDAIVAAALDAASGTATRLQRRSRRASTYHVRIGGPSGPAFFIKIIDAPRGLARFKRWFSGARAAHIHAISAAIRRAGLNAPPVVLWGRERPSGRELVMTRGAPGVLATRYLRGAPLAGFARKRALLRAAGGEIARLHAAGFIHGDLTPFNIIADESPTIAFIDHERTRRVWFRGIAARARRRNLVQLGRFAFSGLTRSDRMRLWSSYAAATAPPLGRAELRRVLKMLDARIARAGALEISHPPQIPAAGGVREA
ncbi:MAG: lipopolysaccharide kinase InaA family protein [Candidatus Binataceae bacterium]